MPRNKQPISKKEEIDPEPLAKSVSELFDKIQKPVKPISKNVFAAIDKIHRLPRVSKIDLIQVNATNFDGEFEYYKMGRGIRIKISSNTVNKELALLHEIGHFIDNQAIGVKGVNESEVRDGELRGVLEAFKETDTIKKLLKMQKTGKFDLMGKMRKLTDKQKCSIEYLLHPREQWARAYGQYIALKSADKFLLEQLNWEINANEIIPTQWKKNDFKNVIFAIDNLLINQKWSRLI